MHPAQGIRFIHIAICREAREIEAQAHEAESPDDLKALGERLALFSARNKFHTDGEEDGMYAELELKAPHVRSAFLHDHKEDHELFQDLGQRITAAREASGATRAGLLVGVRRQSIALTEHVVPHVHKEDALITPLICELFTPAEQGAQIGKMMARFPPAQLASAVPWLIAKIDADDRVAYVGRIQKVMPPDRFAAACGWIRDGVPADVWAGITSRVAGIPA
ncbi:MAG TPA: hemerythrin domain-containing protein [Kofleriaceae bacterium]|nr:hemerythrin domain-containing protein [Kofleriaceae bacterium]